MPPKHIFCMKWGTAYGAKDVNILYAMVARNLTDYFQFTCFTDDTSGIRKEVNCLPLPPLGCEIPADVPGKWPKVALWSKNLYGLEGVALFIDLDSVIVGNIDSYFEHGDPSDVITARNWLNKLSKSAQTSVFRFPIGGHSYMLENLQADPANVSRKFQYEQNYVTHNIKGGVKFWPEPWTRHFRVHCMGAWPLRYLRPPILPKSAKIITFPGLPGPADAMHGKWTETSEARTPGQHLRWVWQKFISGQKWRKHISRYLQKPDWLEKHWRE
ncbi:MAG: glycosyl transferase [Akkermansiaceae bacterium]|nr:glycosyl transferase [Akkermansiaceae bacterium]